MEKRYGSNDNILNLPSKRQFKLEREYSKKTEPSAGVLFFFRVSNSFFSHDFLKIDESDSPSRIIEIKDKVLLIDIGVLVTRAGGDLPSKSPVLSWLLTALTVRTEPFNDLEEVGLYPNSFVPSSRFFLEISSDRVIDSHNLIESERSVTDVDASDFIIGISLIVGDGVGVGVLLVHVFN